MKYLAVCFVLVFFLAISARSEENVIHIYKVGFSTGLSYPNNVLSYPVFIGFKKTVFFDMRLGTSHNILYSLLNYSSYEADKLDIYGHFGTGTNKQLKTNSCDPYKLYSIVTGWGYTTSSTGRFPSLRLCIGLYIDYSREDEMQISSKNTSNEIITEQINAANKLSAGINLRVGLDVPLYKDIFGLCADIELNPKLLGPTSLSSTQHPQGVSLTVGIFGRF